jgi:peptidoglycan/LPS O-acetylase OafA/YrhL
MGVEHWPALDGLRGAAVAAVVLFHLGLLSGGFLGVDLFFTLSGFLITSLLVREWRQHGRIDLGAFWARRCRRLLPAAAAMIGVVLLAVALWGTPAEQAGARGDARWAIPYLANWHLVAQARDYWASATSLSVFNHLWSLAIEEQFYVVWPLVTWWVLRRRGERALLIVALAGALASVVTMVGLAHSGPASRVYFGTDTRVVALLLGAAAATAPIRSVAEWIGRHPRRSDVLAIAVTAVLAASWVTGGRLIGALVGGGLAVHALLATVLVSLLARPTSLPGRWSERSRATAWFGTALLQWLGRRSYGIYLWHWPIIQLLEPRWQSVPSGVRDAVEVALTLAVAEVSYRLLEQPIRRRLGWAAGRRASAATATGIAIATVVAVVAPSGRGHVAAFQLAEGGAPVAAPADPTVVADREPDASSGRTVAAPSTAASTTPPVTESGDTLDAPGTTVAISAGVVAARPSPTVPQRTVSRLLWVGDSVAADLAPAIGAALDAAGVDVTNGARDGVHLAPTTPDDDPRGFYGPMLATAGADVVVVQLSYWDAPAAADDLRASLERFRDTVVATGADLVFVTPPPVRADLVDPRFDGVVAVAADLAATDPAHVHLVDTAPLWGTEMQVDPDHDGAPDRKPDGVHVCPQGAARFAAWFVDALDARFDGLTPAFPGAWVGLDWQTSERYDTPVGACAAIATGTDG